MIVEFNDRHGSAAALAVAGGRFAPAEAGEPSDTIDLTAYWVLPGMVDAHAHLAADSIEGLLADAPEADPERMRANGRRQLSGGVLAALDKGFRSDTSLAYLDVDPAARPYVEMAGGMIATHGGYYDGYGLEVDGGELAAAVAAKAATAAGWVKIVGDWPRRGEGPRPNFTEEELADAVAIAHRAGVRVSVHTMAPHAPGYAVAAGVDSIEHGLFLTASDVEELGARGGAWVPTLAAVESLIEFLGAGSSGGKLLGDGVDNVRSLLPGALEAGVHLMCGTDLAIPHGGVAVEAAALVAAGLTAEEAVDAVSWNAHRYLRRHPPLTAGADADLVAFAGDPREDISALSSPMLAMRRGVILFDRLA